MHQGEILRVRFLIHITKDIITLGMRDVYNLIVADGIVSIFEYPPLTGNVTMTKYMIANGNRICGV